MNVNFCSHQNTFEVISRHFQRSSKMTVKNEKKLQIIVYVNLN